MVFILIVCFAPSLAWLGYFYIRTSRKDIPLRLLLLTFGCGLLAGPLSLLLFQQIERTAFYSDLGRIDRVPDLYKFVYSFFAIGLIEELSKFIIFWYVVHRHRLPLARAGDAMVYAVAAALGFATIENWYFMLAVDEPVFSRAISLPFNHVLFSSLWGVAYARARFQGGGSRLVLTGLLLAMAYHGLYDYILFSESVPNLLVAPLVLVLWVWVALATREMAGWGTARAKPPTT